MEWNWLLSLLYGAIGGFFEFLPVSPQVHLKLLEKLTGVPDPGMALSLAVHLGALTALVVSLWGRIGKLTREKKIAQRPKNRRKRQPDTVSLMELKLLRIAAVPICIACLLTPWLSRYFNELWMMAGFAVLGGIIVMLPQYMNQANKDARSLSPLDAVLIGMSGCLSVFPGISRVSSITAAASMRGGDRQFSWQFCCLLLIPALICLSIGEVGVQILAGGSYASISLFLCVPACAAAFAAAIAAIRLMRFLAVKAGYEAFAYYNWGLAMFTFIIYLIG